ncbi:KamA family radical SAM protein [bacterium]|nr:KamA family radical SAM protein [candidate division CSSED10-310 bacterium]
MENDSDSERNASAKEKLSWDREIAAVLERHLPDDQLMTVLKEILEKADPGITRIFQNSIDLESARRELYRHLSGIEEAVYEGRDGLSGIQRAAVEDCIRVLKNVFAPVNETTTRTGSVRSLWHLFKRTDPDVSPPAGPGFILEFIHLFHGINGRFPINSFSRSIDVNFSRFLKMEGRDAARERSRILDRFGVILNRHFKRYPSGLEPEVISERERNRDRILKYFKGSLDDWTDWKWHIKHLIKRPDTLFDLLQMRKGYAQAVKEAWQHNIPFGITPYYLSLMHYHSRGQFDHAIRRQVIPPPTYVRAMVNHSEEKEFYFDFMGEHDTSPIDLVTRRYPRIAIVKPFNTCAQICVYCQRNWEIQQCMAPESMARRESLNRAIEWFENHPHVGEVLVTGGDPIMMSDRSLNRLLSRLAGIDHIYRIRIGSRTPVVLPFRWTDHLIDNLSGHIEPGRREIVLVTHFEHSFEITPEVAETVGRIRRKGISVYNQQVFTIENSRRFETAKLRCDLRRAGIDPYYTFMPKGKQETLDYLVPIARILQERKEEARLLPGIDRTDEPVFNVPKLGKNHLRAKQDRRLIMIKPDGSRIYEFHPWEKRFTDLSTYIHTDIPIYDYLIKMIERGEDPENYNSIWNYY